HEVLISVSVVPGDPAAVADAALAALAEGVLVEAPPAPWSGDAERDRAILRERAGAIAQRAMRPAPADLPARVARAMAAAAGDPHAFAVDGEELGELLATISGEPFAGLGLSLHPAPGGAWVVSDVHAGGPAEVAGLERGDRIDAIDGEPVDAASLAALLRALRPGQSVRLSASRRGAAAAPHDIVAARVRPPITTSRVLPGKVGYLRIHYLPHAEDPDGDAAVQVAGALRELDRARVKRLVIDLRDNRGGAPFDVASLLVRGDPLLRAQVPGQDPIPLTRTAEPWKVRRKTAVLINEQTTAAAEMIALALRDHGEARLFGQPTAGALTVPGQAQLPGGVVLFFPQALVVGASGAPAPGRRVEPHERIANPGPAEYAAGGDPQLAAALAWLGRRSRSRRGARDRRAPPGRPPPSSPRSPPPPSPPSPPARAPHGPPPAAA